MTAELQVRAGQHSAPGPKAVNEDAVGIRIPEPPLSALKGIAAVIADGVSGAEAGREAAESAVKGFLYDYFSTPESWSAETSAARVLGAINRWLYGQSQKRYGSERGLITTVSILVLKSATAYLFHAGDTRIYRLREGVLEQLTRDHLAHVRGDKPYLNRALGISPDLQLDHKTLPLAPGDVFLLTSDGVHGFLDDRRLKSWLTEEPDPEACARAIVSEALARGGDDNASAQVLKVEALPTADAAEHYRQLTELPFPPPLSEGMKLDGYRILRELHESKRTQVYLALDEDSGRKVILKTPSVNYEDDPRYIDRFLQEEWAGRRINSPHVLKVLEPRPRQCLYYVAEYVEGQTLRQWMRDHPHPSLTVVREIVSQVAAGLRAFHRLEMVHQDLKPENILIDPHGTVKIIDFGSTKIAGIEEIATLWGRDELLGTKDYTAPEYLQGYAGGEHSDLFSLAVIAYEMLTGRLPYALAPTPKNLKRLRYRSAREIVPELPVWVDGCLERGVKLDPAQRYAVISEFVYDLSHPNPAYAERPNAPLMERNPLGMWRTVAGLSLLLNLVLLALASGAFG